MKYSKELITQDPKLAQKLLIGLKKVFNKKQLQDMQVNSVYSTKMTKDHRGYMSTRSLSMNFNDISNSILNRQNLFRLYLIMLNDPILSAALNIFADLCVTKNLFNLLITISLCNNLKIKESLENLFYNTLNIELNLWPWVRNLCKYGDFFLLLQLTPGVGVTDYNPLSVYDVLRVEYEYDRYGKMKLHALTFFRVNNILISNHRMLHFRLINDTNLYPYGKSILLNARTMWKKYTLLLDAVLIQRITRAPAKYIFSIDPGNLDPDLAEQYLSEVKRNMKKQCYVDQNGNIDLRYNIQNMMLDFFVLKSQDSGTSIDTTGGLDYNAIEDVLMFRDNMLAGLTIPKAFLTFTLLLSGKSVLSSQDIRFNRTILHIQAVVNAQLKKVGIIHLYLQGYRDSDLTDWDVQLNNSSNIKLMQLLLLWQNRIDLGSSMMDSKQFSRKYVYKHVYKMSDELIKQEMQDLILDAKYNRYIESFEQSELALNPYEADNNKESLFDTMSSLTNYKPHKFV